MVFREAVSAFCRKRRFAALIHDADGDIDIEFFASASAAATIVLIAARLMYFLLGKSAE